MYGFPHDTMGCKNKLKRWYVQVPRGRIKVSRREEGTVMCT